MTAQAQPVRVEARLEADGTVMPVGLTWQGRYQRVTDVGRQWTADHEGVPHRHVLVMLANRDRLELALDQSNLTWRVVQVWSTPTFG